MIDGNQEKAGKVIVMGAKNYDLETLAPLMGLCLNVSVSVVPVERN